MTLIHHHIALFALDVSADSHRRTHGGDYYTHHRTRPRESDDALETADCAVAVDSGYSHPDQNRLIETGSSYGFSRVFWIDDFLLDDAGAVGGEQLFKIVCALFEAGAGVGIADFKPFLLCVENFFLRENVAVV